MQKSDERILTTHVGSLPRNPELTDLLIDQEQGKGNRYRRAGAPIRNRGATRGFGAAQSGCGYRQ